MTANCKRYLLVAVISSVVSSVSVLFCMINAEKPFETVLKILLSLLFWGGTALEQTFMWKANACRKKSENGGGNRNIKMLPGICSFSKTEFGFITDAVLLLSTVTFVVLAIGNWGESVAQYILLFLIVLSFRLHCIANGKNYRYIILSQGRKKSYGSNE